MCRFQAKRLRYDHSRCVVCDSVPIFGTKMIGASCYGKQCYRTGFFQIIFINIIFHFLSVKNDYFCETSTKNMVQNGTHRIITKISPYLMGNTEIL